MEAGVMVLLISTFVQQDTYDIPELLEVTLDLPK